MKVLWLLAFWVGCPHKFADPAREFADPVSGDTIYEEEIHHPDPEGVWESKLKDDSEGPSRAACSTCHGPNPTRVAPSKPGEEFHGLVEVHHGSLTCFQCHDRDRTRLHTADGATFDFAETMRLCAQCHGPQYRDFVHGTHGGKNGYWDLRQGPRIRNDCTDCHTPHAPAFPSVTPVFAPRDRNPRGH